MSVRKRILFIVHTEYHMMLTISMIADLFHDDKVFDVWVVQTIDRNRRRFRFSKNLSFFTHVKYQELEYDEGNFERNSQFTSFVSELKGLLIDTCVIFNKLAYIGFYVSQLLRKRTKVVLAQDGTAAYIRISSFTPRWSLLLAFNTHRFLWCNGIRIFFLYWPTLVYGRSKAVCELWAQYPSHVLNIAQKPIRKVAVLESKRSIEAARLFFDYDPSLVFEHCIFYTNQPFSDARIRNVEIEILKELKLKFPEKKIIIKLHPSTHQSQMDQFKRLQGVYVLETTMPAELIIANLSHAIVLSFWSTALLVNNKSCQFYWLYPLLRKNGIDMHKVLFCETFPHIKLIDDLSMLK